MAADWPGDTSGDSEVEMEHPLTDYSVLRTPHPIS